MLSGLVPRDLVLRCHLSFGIIFYFFSFTARFIFLPSANTSNGDDEVYLFPLEPAHILGTTAATAMTRFIFFPSSPSTSLGGTSNGDDEVYFFPL